MLSLLFLLGLLLEGQAWVLVGFLPVAVRRYINYYCPNFGIAQPRTSAIRMLLLASGGAVVLAADCLVLTPENIIAAAEVGFPPSLGLFFGLGSWAVGLLLARVLRDLIDYKYPSLSRAEISCAALTTILLAPSGCLCLVISRLIIKVTLPTYSARIATEFSVGMFAVLFVACCSLVFRSVYKETRKGKKHPETHS